MRPGLEEYSNSSSYIEEMKRIKLIGVLVIFMLLLVK